MSLKKISFAVIALVVVVYGLDYYQSQNAEDPHKVVYFDNYSPKGSKYLKFDA